MFDTSAPAHITVNDREWKGARDADATRRPYPRDPRARTHDWMAAMSAEQRIVLTDRAEIMAALESSHLLPHPSGDARDGATNRLRAEMARFSGPAEHAGRRRAVVEDIRAIDAERAHALAVERAAMRLSGDPIDGIEIAGTVPTEAVASCLALNAPLAPVV